MPNSLWSPCTVAHQAPLSVGFSMQEYSSGLPFPSPGDLPDPGIEHASPTLQADVLPSEPPRKPQRNQKGRALRPWKCLFLNFLTLKDHSFQGNDPQLGQYSRLKLHKSLQWQMFFLLINLEDCILLPSYPKNIYSGNMDFFHSWLGFLRSSCTVDILCCDS